MIPEEFEDALARALHGEVMTDLRPEPEMLDALLRVAAAVDPAARRTAVRTARRLQEAQQEQEQEQEQEEEPFD